MVYLSKFPPSPSGVAVYAEAFERVLACGGDVRRVAAPPDPADSQRLSSALRGLLAGAALRLNGVDLVHVELSGRALYEFFFLLAVLARRTRPRVVVTCHDAPSVVGASLMFRSLDRKGLRRVGTLLSNHPGRALERRAIRGCDAVFALTEPGAEALTAAYGRTVHALPHAIKAPDRTRIPKRPVIFVPGYVSDVDGIVGVVGEAALAAESGRPDWCVVVGSFSPGLPDRVRARLSPVQLRRVEFQGHVGNDALLESFGQASVVVRLHAGSAAHNSFAASGPLALALTWGCICITNDDRAGAVEMARYGLVEVTTDPARALRKHLDEVESAETAARIAADAQDRYGIDAVAERYQSVVQRESSAPPG